MYFWVFARAEWPHVLTCGNAGLGTIGWDDGWLATFLPSFKHMVGGSAQKPVLYKAGTPKDDWLSVRIALVYSRGTTNVPKGGSAPFFAPLRGSRLARDAAWGGRP